MERREFISLIGGAAAAWPLAARAQQRERKRRIGVLSVVAESDPDLPARVTAFRQELGKLGWMEGRNVGIDFRWSGGNRERMRTYAKEFNGVMPM